MSQNDTPSTPELFRTLWRALPDLFRSNPWAVSALISVSIVRGLLPALTILLGKWTVDGVVAAVAGAEVNITLLVIAWAGAAFLTQALFALYGLLQGYVVDHFTIATSQQLMNKMQDLQGLALLESAEFYDNVDILQQECHARPLNLLAASMSLLNQIITIIGMMTTLLVISWWTPFIVIIGIVPLARRKMALYKLGWSITIRNTQEARELRYEQRIAMRHEYAKELRLYGILPYLKQRYLARATSYQKVMRSIRNKELLHVLPYQLLMLLATSGLFIYVVFQSKAGYLSAGDVTLLITALAQIRRELESSSNLLSHMANHLSWFHKFYTFLAATPRITNPIHARALPAKLDIHLDNLSFHYKTDVPVLENISLHIPEGQIVAIVGENGAGKSTLVKLLLRFYDPSHGSIHIGTDAEQTDLREVDIEAWREQIGAIFQDFAKFEWTWRDNILLGKAEDEARLQHAIEASGLDGVLERTQNNLEQRIGQAFDGIDLSGGQWQKLVTARAMYRQARILILDEPTAALDPRSEAEVFASFAALAQGRTTLLITHRLGSVQMADRILVMKEGRLIEDGTHEQLLAQQGEYAELWALQAKQYQE